MLQMFLPRKHISGFGPEFHTSNQLITISNWLLFIVYILVLLVVVWCIQSANGKTKNENKIFPVAVLAMVMWFTSLGVFFSGTVKKTYIKSYSFDNGAYIKVYKVHSRAHTGYISKVYKYVPNTGFRERKFQYQYATESRPYPTAHVIDKEYLK